MVLSWFFQERKWAIRIVERVCIDIRSPEATEAIELIIFGTRRSPARSLPVRERSIITATGLWTNSSAITQFCKMVPVSEVEAARFLKRIGQSAVSVGEAEGLGAVLTKTMGSRLDALRND